MPRLILLSHRYLGIGVGALMVLWCLSGVVMMYVSYPALDENVRLKALPPIAWDGCCTIADAVRAGSPFDAGSQIEMLAGRPVLFLGRNSHPIDLLAGAYLDGISAEQAAEVAAGFAAGPRAAPRLLGLVSSDQWTVSGDFNSQRPLYRFSLNDAAGTEIYVSSVSGRAAQITTARERFWNWLGAIPHWLYFTELRRHPALWSQIVIYTSLLGCFLAGIGIYLGVRQLAAQPAGRWSPYAGFNLWHHAAGLVFGLFTLTWVASGLLSMNPWGWLEGGGAHAETARIHGTPESPDRSITGALQAIALLRPAAVSLQGAPLDGKLYFIASTASGERRRLDAGGVPAPLAGQELTYLSSALNGAGRAGALELLTHEDNYYFSHHREAAILPVYRLVLASGTRYYLDFVSGMIVAKLDAEARAYRWLHEGLHRMDFAAPLRARPRWDGLMLLLMSGVTVVCATGAYLGYRRLTRSAGQEPARSMVGKCDPQS
jgi:hypothetical protein